MSILWGVVQEPGATIREADILALSVHTRQFATSEPTVFARGRAGFGLQLYRSHTRSAMDCRPFSDEQRNIVCFDGRLDNFSELIEALGLEDRDTSDSQIILKALERWGEACFSQLTGDWALALWCERQQKLFLARDHAGARSLYFTHSEGQIRWATHLDTLTGSESQLHISRDYAAAYLTFSPVRDLTPYVEIRSVLPGHYIVFQGAQIVQNAHWSPLIHRSIRYKADADYDEHFLSVFGTAVARRTTPGEPILAQLSGGMDSTSIVCMSDHMRRCADPQAEILDTISFFDDSEQSLDERRYFEITERQRRKSGIHLEISSSQRTFELTTDFGTYQTPGCDNFSLKIEQTLYGLIWERGYRVILSGLGGDEVLGGVPDGRPGLADYLVAGRWLTLLRRALGWSLPERVPLIQTLAGTMRYAVSLYATCNPKRRPIPSWLSKSLRRSFVDLDRRTGSVLHRVGAAPHRVENALTWWQIMEMLPHLSPQLLFNPEYRYPMLDKNLVEFLFSIPPKQLVQPGRRRAMMRRALRGIVPHEILERRRKSFQLRTSLSAIRSAQNKLEQLISTSVLAEMGFIDVNAFISELKATTDGRPHGYHAIQRAIAYELWLQTRFGRSSPSPSSLLDRIWPTPNGRQAPHDLNSAGS